MKTKTLSKSLASKVGILAGGIALGAMLAGSALAEPAIIYDLGGKFDKSFNESAYNGATAWAEETGLSFQDIELQTDAQREQALRQFARRGSNPIVVAGFSWATALGKVAAEFPETNFAIIDMVVDAPNVRSVVFNEHEGSFLVGALAAMKSETGKVGFVGGMDIPLIRKFYCGYAQGARAVNPDIELFENYTGTTPAAWNDPITAGELAKAAMARGADVIYAAAGGSGLGVLQAAADEGKFSIGVDANQNYIQPGSVLTSMLKRVDLAVASAFADQTNGEWTSGFQVMGIGNEGVGWSLDEFNADLITDEMKDAVDALSAKIQSGEIVVHDYTTDGTCPVS
ncbi:MAG: BMP family ABC transporter substrate-binding protein [Devosiaceae bacterium]|nr:BMP family ABC transporter substrate-binding protein [Devosiaceae bacterium]